MIEVMYLAREEFLPLLQIDLTDGSTNHRLRAEDLRVNTGNARITRFEIAAPDTLTLGTALVRTDLELDTLAAIDATVGVLPGRTYRVFVTVSDRPIYGSTIDTVFAAPIRPGASARPDESLLVGWGHWINRGPSPVP